MFPVREVISFGLLAGVLAAVVLAVWPWCRHHWRFLVAGVATSVGFIVWNLTLNATDATGFNIDAPIIPLSWADAGSGVMVFGACALVLGLIAERQEPAGRVVGAAAIAGLVATILDIFVL